MDFPGRHSNQITSSLQVTLTSVQATSPHSLLSLTEALGEKLYHHPHF